MSFDIERLRLQHKIEKNRKIIEANGAEELKMLAEIDELKSRCWIVDAPGNTIVPTGAGGADLSEDDENDVDSMEDLVGKNYWRRHLKSKLKVAYDNLLKTNEALKKTNEEQANAIEEFEKKRKFEASTLPADYDRLVENERSLLGRVSEQTIVIILYRDRSEQLLSELESERRDFDAEIERLSKALEEKTKTIGQ